MGAILNVFGDNSRVQRAMLSYEVRVTIRSTGRWLNVLLSGRFQ